MTTYVIVAMNNGPPIQFRFVVINGNEDAVMSYYLTREFEDGFTDLKTCDSVAEALEVVAPYMHLSEGGS